MTFKLLLALAMSAIALVGCEGFKDEVTKGDLDAAIRAATPETKRLVYLFESNPASVTAHQVQGLLDRGASANAIFETSRDYATVLMSAAQYNSNPEVISVLLKAGAEVNARTPRDGRTPLMFAAKNNNPEVISVLLAAGADVNAKEGEGFKYSGGDGETPLIVAVEYNENPEVISLLIRAGADVNARTEWEETPLIVAAKNNENPEVISVLLKAGADVNAINTHGEIALDYAQRNLEGTQALKELEAATNP